MSVKKEQILGSNKIVVGEKYNDLVLRTLGKVYIQTGSSIALLNDVINKMAKSEVSKSNLTIVAKDEDVNSSGAADESFIFVQSSANLYIVVNGVAIPIVAKNEAEINWTNLKKEFISKHEDGFVNGTLGANDLTSNGLNVNDAVFNNPVKINSEIAPLEIESRELVKNLNAEYLGGIKNDRFTIRDANESISGSWTFNRETLFDEVVKYGGSLISKYGFASGFSGYGWKLDDKSNTLTIDNLVVRKAMHVYELIVNRINATNGSFWVSDSGKVAEASLIVPDVWYDEAGVQNSFFYSSIDAQADEHWILAKGYWNKDGIWTMDDIWPKNVGEKYYKNPSDSILEDTPNFRWFSWYAKDVGPLCEGFRGVVDENAETLVYKHYTINQDREDKLTDLFLDLDVALTQIKGEAANRHLYSYYYAKGDFYKIVLEDDTKYYPFRVNDIVRCQKFEGNHIKYYDAIVTRVVQGEFMIIRVAYDEFAASLTFNGEEKVYVRPESGDSLVRMGNTVNSSRQGAIYMTSNEQNSPYIDVLQDLRRPDFSRPLEYTNGAVDKTLKIRLGNLDGIHDPDFIVQPNGYGLYGENVFIKGNFVQVTPSGNKPVPIYRGQWDSTQEYRIGDQVTFGGKLYSCIKKPINKEDPSDTLFWELVVDSGIPGEPGLSSVQASLYRRAATEPDFPSSAVWSFKQGRFVSLPHLWLDYIPEANGEPCWVTDGSASSSKDEVTITNWTNARKLVQDGINGLPGTPGEQGPSLTFYGLYDKNIKYPLSNKNRVVVEVRENSNSTFFMSKLVDPPRESTTGFNNPLDSGDFEMFGGNFQSLATGLLFAKDAHLDVVNIGNGIWFPESPYGSGKRLKINAEGIKYGTPTNPEFQIGIDGSFISPEAGIYGKPSSSVVPRFYSGVNYSGAQNIIDGTEVNERSFIVDSSGRLLSTSGIIGGWNISSTGLSNGKMSIDSVNGINFNDVFKLDATGKIVASNAVITGEIYASKGTFNKGFFTDCEITGTLTVANLGSNTITLLGTDIYTLLSNDTVTSEAYLPGQTPVQRAGLETIKGRRTILINSQLGGIAGDNVFPIVWAMPTEGTNHLYPTVLKRYRSALGQDIPWAFRLSDDSTGNVGKIAVCWAVIPNNNFTAIIS